MPKATKYHVYQKGLLIGTLSLFPEHVKRLEKQGFFVKPITEAKKNSAQRRRPVAVRKRSANPKSLTLIYKSITRVEGTKGKGSAYPGQRFFHNFKRPYPSMYGTPDGKALIIK